MILGLSQELPASEDGSRKHPKLALVSDIGITLADEKNLRPGWDDTVSTPSLLVWPDDDPHAQPGVVHPDRDVRGGCLRAPGRSTGRLHLLGRVQPPEHPAHHRAGPERRLERQRHHRSRRTARPSSRSRLSAGELGPRRLQSSASTRGSPGRASRSASRCIEFKDDGKDSQGHSPDDKERCDPKHCDRAANDGIYTAFIPLDEIDRSHRDPGLRPGRYDRRQGARYIASR